MKVFVHLAEGFEEIEALTVVDVLRRAGVEAVTVSVTGERIVTGSHDIPVIADLLFEQAEYGAADMIVLPGGMPGTKNLAAHTGLIKNIEKFAEEDRWIAAICAAPMILGGLGLLKGRQAVIYPGMEDYLTGARVGKDNVVKDGHIITSKGPGTAMEFAVALVAILKGGDAASALKRSMVLA
jgi:4-methyl-5(b-hydroxyethyl)-thiazole monophosphate biosynthesis